MIDALEDGRKLFAQECVFAGGAPTIAGLPEPSLPEVAFAGRSNVGKSSLVNALTGRKTLARTSNTPGRTREINFFDLGGRLRLVDLPGYGYARVSKREADAWTDTVIAYLAERRTLQRLCLLIDARRGLMDADEAAMALCDEAAVSFWGVLTKCDKLKPQELEAVAGQTGAALAKHPAAHPSMFETSSVAGTGIEALRAAIAALAKA